jgi:ferredoxin
MAVTRRLRVDPVACDAFGHCAELAPELIALDEWGYPVIDERPIPPELIGLAEAAVRICPRRALFVEETATAGGPRRGRSTPVRVLGRR